jgi:hypothetical protein
MINRYIANIDQNAERMLNQGNLPTYEETGFKFEGKTIGDIIGGLLPYVYVLAGLILLLMLIAGGIGLMTSAGNPDKTKVAQGRITGAFIGFIIVFISYLVAKIVEVALGVKFM